MHCPRCSAELAGPVPTCGDCGCPLELLCEQCGRPSPVGASFCAGCGAPLKALREALPQFSENVDPAVGSPPAYGLEGERRVVTIVLSDLSGYTAMGERLDPEEVSAVMRSIKRDATAIVESLGGTVNQFVGDEIVSLFGLPNAADDDARRAVAAALELHGHVAELSGTSGPTGAPFSMHSGIQTGLLVAETHDVRGGLYELTGDTINTASRLLSLAGPGEVVVGKATLAAIAPFFEIEPAGVHEVRGKAAPLSAFRVLRPLANRSRFDASKARGLTRLTGRSEELGCLEELLAEAARSVGEVVVVEGDAGAGKSRLCHDFLESVHRTEEAVAVLVGRNQAYGSRTPYLPFVQVIRSALELGEHDSTEEVMAKAGDGLERIDAALTSRCSLFLYLLSAIEVTDLPPEWQGEELPRLLQDAIVDLVIAMSRRTTTIVYLEDWHWVDEASYSTLLRLARAVEKNRVLLLITSRPPMNLPQGVDAQRINLGALSAYETTLMIAGCFDSESVQSTLAAKIYDRTMGNPLFIEEVCAVLLDQGDVVSAEGDVVFAGDSEKFDCPPTVEAVILSRVDALPPRTREFMRVASVVGREFGTRVMERLVAPQRQMTAALEELERLGLVVRMPGAEAGSYQFKHVIIQEVTYGTLLVRERASVHARIAEVLEEYTSVDETEQSKNAEQLAHHYCQAGNSAKALIYLEQAGRKAVARYALAEARQHLRSAIEESLKLGDSIEVRRQRANLTLLWAYACIFGPSLSQIELLEVAYREAIERDDWRTALQCRYWISYVQYAVGNQSAAEKEVDAAISMAEHRMDSDMAGRLYAHRGQIYLVQRRLDVAAQELAIGLREREEAAAQSGAELTGTYPFHVVQLAILAADRGDFASAHREVTRALELVRNSGERSREASLLISAAMCFGFEGDWEHVREAAAETRAIAEYVGAPYHLACADVFEGYATFHIGDQSEGLTMMRSGLTAHERSGAYLTLCLTRAYVADALERSGSWQEAIELARAALARSDVGDRLGDDLARRVLLRCAARQTPDLVPSAIERARSVALERGSPREKALFELAAAQASLLLGDGTRARDHADRAIVELGALGAAWFVDEAEKVRARALELV